MTYKYFYIFLLKNVIRIRIVSIFVVSKLKNTDMTNTARITTGNFITTGTTVDRFAKAGLQGTKVELTTKVK